MRRRDLLAAAPLLAPLPLLLSAGVAEAQEDAKSKGVGQYVDISPVALPIGVNGRLLNYVFATVRVNLSSGADANKMREREPYFRDALVRAGHRTPFTLATDYNRLDQAKLKASLMREAGAIVGASNLSSVTVVSETPRRRVSNPKR
jgi:hypothetical protein